MEQATNVSTDVGEPARARGNAVPLSGRRFAVALLLERREDTVGKKKLPLWQLYPQQKREQHRRQR